MLDDILLDIMGGVLVICSLLTMGAFVAGLFMIGGGKALLVLAAILGLLLISWGIGHIMRVFMDWP